MRIGRPRPPRTLILPCKARARRSLFHDEHLPVAPECRRDCSLLAALPNPLINVRWRYCKEDCGRPASESSPVLLTLGCVEDPLSCLGRELGKGPEETLWFHDDGD